MHTLVFATQKGGSGKSTLAACIAVAARQAGERVFVLDMDPQRSLVQWAKMRAESSIPVEPVSAGKLPAALAALAAAKITLVIIDTPGTDCAAATAAMAAADLCIIPARPTAFDLWSSEATRKILAGLGKPFAFVLAQCPAQASPRVADGAAALEAMGGLLTPLVTARVDYQEAMSHGLGVTELNADGRAAHEMRDLWRSIKRMLGRGRAKKAA